MISRKFGFTAAFILFGFSCKSISPKKNSKLTASPEPSAQGSVIALEDPTKLEVMEPLSAGNFETLIELKPISGGRPVGWIVFTVAERLGDVSL